MTSKKAVQSGPSHVAGNTNHRVSAATTTTATITSKKISTDVISPAEEEEFELYLSSDLEEEEVDVEEKKMRMPATLRKFRHWVQIKRKSFIPNTISDESARIGRYFRILDNTLDDIIYVLDDKRGQGFSTEKGAQGSKQGEEVPEIMLDFLLDVERSETTPEPPATPIPVHLHS
ncbi:hypothetical protein Fcan01_18408 [Folsomia candida]|uniref:Uncharacterized protein n=1 Tax=Folsomia candida TaxID=158441 RepID=A0A226DQK8_FOLCA|nr:hypothetical protein Fcan01_18408 [Folsomia candida]